MDNRRIGFIGMGNMAQAMLKGLKDYAGYDAQYLAFAPNQEKLKKNGELLGFEPKVSVAELVSASDVVFMACKPYQIEQVLESTSFDGKTIISVAFGWDFETYSKFIDTQKVRVQYILPNTPISIGEGLIFMENMSSLSENERNEWKNIFSNMAEIIDIDAHLIPAGSAVGGCGPAFVDIFIEALADGGVKNGLPRDVAYKAVAQMVAGSAKMMQHSGLHPGQLKDQVCSPGGTTIRGVAAMEEGGVRSAMIKAVDAACGK